jgi:hypothetical protein
VRLGIDGLPEVDPISTSRPRGNEGIPVLDKPPADVVAAAAAASQPAKVAEPEPTAKTPVVAEKATAAVPPAREVLPTLQSAPESVNVGSSEATTSEPPPSMPPRSMSLSGAPGAVRRKTRGGNLRPSSPSRSSLPPATVTTSVAPQREHVTQDPVSSRATVPAPVVEEPKSKDTSDRAGVGPASTDVDQEFFERESSAGAESHDAHDLDHYDERMVRMSSPEAQARREKNWMYIRWAAGVCVTLMAAALVRNSMHHSEEAPEPPPVVTVVPSHAGANGPAGAASTGPALVNGAPSAAPATSTAPQAVASAGPAASAIPTASAEDLPSAPAAAGSAKLQEPVAALGPAANVKGTDPATAQAIPVVVPPEPTESERKSAAQEKRSCQSLLDQGAFAKAVEAGERSVALDPADGEAWLMLGAAYQSMGKSAEARRSFSSCVAEAKKGPVNECRAMLR